MKKLVFLAVLAFLFSGCPKDDDPPPPPPLPPVEPALYTGFNYWRECDIFWNSNVFNSNITTGCCLFTYDSYKYGTGTPPNAALTTITGYTKGGKFYNDEDDELFVYEFLTRSYFDADWNKNLALPNGGQKDNNALKLNQCAQA